MIFNKTLFLSLFAAMGTALISPLSIAATPVDFTSQDWQVACDNTLTCRMAGYQAENDSDFPVSILLVRKAGANATVEGRVKLGGTKKNATKALMQLGNRHRISLIIDGNDLGETEPFSSTTNDANLTAAQVTALVDALAKSSTIELALRNSRWQLSDKGASAVMSKADEAQGRVGTSSAFINSGNSTKSNAKVLSPKSAPNLTFVSPNPKAKSKSKRKFVMRSSQLSTLMKDTLKDADNDCPNLFDKSSWRVSRLNSSQLLAKHDCWTGAYNTGMGVWVLNDSKPYNPTLVTTSATGYNQGKITSVQKGRGIGDCVAKTDWVWIGRRFVKSHESHTGLCRMVEDGGAWEMPIYVSNVRIPS